MWWLDPGKEVLNVLFNRILAPYVENLDLNQVNYGIGQGQLTLRNLRLKKGALDKFRLPVDVLQGHLGKLSLSLHWLNLGNQPVEILVEDVYLLVVPSSQTNYDPEEEENRAQAAKAERLENAELLHMRGRAETSEESVQTQGLWESLIAKVINNLQITVQNIHIRYEDNLSVPGHPFAAGVTLAGFTATSVNEDWQPAFIESTAGAIHKLANLQSLALYFDTDAPSMAELTPMAAKKKFFDMISHARQDNSHQFILKPVSGEGRIIVNHKVDQKTPRFDVQLIFDEIGVALDDNQYRDVISLLDMYHVFVRQRQYRKFRPQEFSSSTPKARLLFAGNAILEGVRERNRKWTWPYFAERRDDRNKYVHLFEKQLLNALSGTEQQELAALERKLSYEDIRFYRSIARSRLRKDQALRKKIESERKPEPAKQGWTSWLWGSSSSSNSSRAEPAFGGPMTAEQRKELYEVLDYDEKTALAESFQTPRDSLKARIAARLNKGSFELKSDPHGQSKEVISVIFDVFQADFIQRPDNFEASISLGGFGVFDGTTKDSLYSQIVRVKDKETEDIPTRTPESTTQPDPFFFVKFEKSPLDERADSALTMRMRHMEIIYHKGYVEAVYKFLKPPATQLESVEALLNVASQTFEGLRKETRAGLEYALQTHKTVDIHVDMNAPVIIIPEDVTTLDCKHLMIDAGHISIESDLADKEAIRAIHTKRNKIYDDNDYQYLESLMYDKLSLKLDAAQFVIGNNLQSCLDALDSGSSDSLHLLERTNIDLQVHNSIVPTALSLARFKVSGKLPSLTVNFSDTKYKALMRLIDVCVPRLGDGESRSAPAVPASSSNSGGFQLAPGLFSASDAEYNVDDAGDDTDDDDNDSREDLFFEAEDGTSGRPELHQHVFELNFQVDNLRATIFKSASDGVEKPLGDVSFDGFMLALALAKYDMKVNISLRSLSLDLVQLGISQPLRFISSTESDSSHDDLLTVAYTRVQKDSPEFASVYEGIDQNVDIKVSTFIFRTAPEPVISLYDFVMTTFASQSDTQHRNQGVQAYKDSTQDQLKSEPPTDAKIRVLVKLASVQVILVHGLENLATISLSTADVTVLLRPKTLRIAGRLGSLALSNDTRAYAIHEEFNQILSIEGQNFAEFRYQTFDPDDESYAGIKSSVYLNTASLKLHFLEQPLRDIYLFVAKLAKLKGLYDAATQVAVQTASTIERMQFEVSVKTPILVFPSDPAKSPDVLVMKLGEITARNTSDPVINKIEASLTGIQLVSAIYKDGEASVLKIIENINITADMIQTSNIDRQSDRDFPETQVIVKISDVRLHLTQVQYELLVRLSQSVPKVLEGTPEEELLTSIGPISTGTPSNHDAQSLVDLEPEVRTVPSITSNWTAIDLVISVNAIKLHLYDANATTDANIKEHGIARFALTDNTLRFKLLSDGSGEAQVVMRSFTMSNTRPGNSKFREIIPAAQHERNQFMILYTISGGSTGVSLLVLTVDSPKIIFAVDPIIALLAFFRSPFTSLISDPEEYSAEAESADSTPRKMDFRIDLHDLSVSVLEDDSVSETQSITLSVDHILLSQQGIVALSVKRLGMSLMRMGKSSESVRLLDDFDLTLSLDSRSSSSQQMTSIEVTAKPIVVRASYSDLVLISSIINKAIALYGSSTRTSVPPDVIAAKPSNTVRSAGLSKSSTPRSRRRTIGNARVLMSKEQLTGSFDGLRLVLISDLNEQPMLHLKVKPFIIGVKDWSGELQGTTTIAIHITYWNLTNSHWEPVIDPWVFTIGVVKDDPSAGTNVTLSARERLDINLSTTFTELAATTLQMWGKADHAIQKPRGGYAPYRIRNRTGTAIMVWSDLDSSMGIEDAAPVKVLHDQTIEWRFDDWKTMREHVSSSGQHSIGLQFVGKAWEPLRSVPVDREGDFTFSLRPRTKYPSRLLCEVKVMENVKIVTIRSIYKVENQTLYPLELTLVDDLGHPVYAMEKIAPGQDYSLPIEAVLQNKIRIQPDLGFGYKWCSAIRFEDLLARKSFTIRCPHSDPTEAAFRFQAWVQTDAQDPAAGKLPKVNLKLRAPLELENLLPYNLEYRIYDKDTDQNWRSYLRKGGVMPVHSVELAHFVLLNVDVQDTTFKPSEFAIINTDGHSDFDIENRLTLHDQQDRKLDLRLNYVRYPDSGGAFKVQIYCPYIIINKTDLPFSVKSARSTRAGSKDVAGDARPDVLARPFPFLLSHPHENSQEYIFKIGDSAWSKIISMEAPAAETALVIDSQKRGSEEVHAGLTWSEGLGKYKLTKVITLTPRFLVKNNLTEPISFREHGVPPRDRSIINPRVRQPLQVFRVGQEKLLTIAYPGLNAQWSPPINIEDIGTVHFRLRAPADTAARLIRADVQVEGSTIFIFFSSSKDWPFAIENESDHVIKFCQQDLERENQGSSTKAYPTYTVDPHRTALYAWDFPAARDKKLILMINDTHRVVDIMEIGNLIPFKFNANQRTKAVSLDVRADGHKQILRITNYNPERSIYKPRARSSLASITRQDTISSSAEAFEAVAENVPIALTFTVDLSGIGVSLVNRRMIEVVYISLDALKLEYTNSLVAQAFNLSCGMLQVDNQLHDALYPVVIQPTPIGKEASGVAPLPTVQASILWLKDQEHGVLFIKYCSILLQALTIEADEDLLFSIYDLTQIKGASWEGETEDILLQNIDTIPEPVDKAVGQELYFEILELQPIKLSLSFMRTERVSSEEKLSIRNPLAVIVNALTMTVGNVNDASLELNALGLKDMRLSMPELQSRITYHYRQDILRQLYRVLGSADFIGNPVGLFTNVSSGVADIFYEPFHGVVMHGNRELGIGIAKGAASFVKKTIFGLSDSMTKFTSSVGKGLSAATFDSEYQARRRMAQRRNKPRHAIYGVAAGGEAFASSVTSAMEGVLMKPIEGAESEGALGFFKGVGKGLVGVVTKPVIGVFDLASNVSEGIRNTTTVFDSPARERVRLPRHVSADGVLRPYSAREALGQYWMKDLNNGAYRQESYVAHIYSTGDDNVVLLTTSRVLSFRSKNLRLDWELSFTDVQGVTVEDTGIRFAHKAGKENDKFAFIPDKSSQSWFFGHLASVVKAFNAKKRMDG